MYIYRSVLFWHRRCRGGVGSSEGDNLAISGSPLDVTIAPISRLRIVTCAHTPADACDAWKRGAKVCLHRRLTHHDHPTPPRIAPPTLLFPCNVIVDWGLKEGGGVKVSSAPRRRCTYSKSGAKKGTPSIGQQSVCFQNWRTKFSPRPVLVTSEKNNSCLQLFGTKM